MTTEWIVKPEFSGKAKAGLVLSLLGMFCILPGIGALAGIILGYLAQRDIKRSHGRIGGQEMAKWSVFLGVVGLIVSPILLAMVAPALTQGKTTAPRVLAMNHAKMLGLGIAIYADDHKGGYPPDLATLVEQGVSVPDQFVFRWSGTEAPQSAADIRDRSMTDFVYLGSGLTDRINNPERVVVMHTKPATRARQGEPWTVLLFADGHVEVAPYETAEEAATANNWILGVPEPQATKPTAPAQGLAP